MNKLEQRARNKRHAGKYGHGRRFYTSLDIAIIKHDGAVENAKEKRGEIKRNNNRYISICGCGHEGCFIHGNYKSKPRMKIVYEGFEKKNVLA